METTGSYLTVLQSLTRIQESLEDSNSIHSALHLILDELVAVLKPETALIGLLNQNNQKIEIQVSFGLEDSTTPIPIKQSIVGWSAFHNRSVHLGNFGNARFTPIKSTSSSAIAIPMIIEGKVIGVVNLEHSQETHFTENDFDLVKLISSEASKTVAYYWLTNQLKTKSQQLQSMIRLSNDLVATLDRNSILENLAKEAREIISCHSTALFLFSKNKEHLELHTMIGAQGALEEISTIETTHSAIGSVLRRPKQIDISNILYTEDNDFNKIIKREGLISMLITPIIFQNEVIGVLNAYTEETHRFSDDEKRILMAISDLGAITLENARLYEKTFKGEEILRKNDKLTTLGLLSAEIAHEIRNPLTVIKLLFQTLDLKFSPTDPRTKDTELISEKINHLEIIVERVLGFSHINHNTKTENSLNNLTQESLQLVRLKLNQLKITLELEATEPNIMVEVNKGQIQQVILNLIFNASQAMPETGGAIKIRIYQDAHKAYFNIKDNGHGIPKALQDHIFESFLTNRSEGTGLGLSISKGILESHQGTIELLESNSKGSTFEFSIPI